jgi:glycosyltransferase involved in cell wall biosynthesis
MNILYVVNDFFPLFYGGVERYVLNISKQMQRTGHRVKVLTYGMDDKRNGYSRWGDMFLKKYLYEQVPVLCVRHDEIPPDIGYRTDDFLMEKHLCDLLQQEHIDIVHVAHPMKLCSVINSAHHLNIPLFLTLTDFWLLCPRGRFFKPDYSPCNSPMEGRKCMKECGADSSVIQRYAHAYALFQKADHIIAPSRFIIKVFEQNGWQKEIALVKHGVDYARIAAPSGRIHRKRNGPLVFGYTGLITRFKGVDLLVQSFKRVKNDKIALHIHGDIYKEWVWERDFYYELRNSIKDDMRIKFLGKYSHDQLQDIFSSIDMTVVPSTTLESYGLVVTESLLYSVPVLVSDIVGSAYEYISDGVNGFVFSVNHPESLGEIIGRIAAHPSLLDMLRENIVPPPRIEEEAFMLECLYGRGNG